LRHFAPQQRHVVKAEGEYTARSHSAAADHIYGWVGVGVAKGRKWRTRRVYIMNDVAVVRAGGFKWNDDVAADIVC